MGGILALRPQGLKPGLCLGCNGTAGSRALPQARRDKGQRPHPFAKLRAGSVAKNATRMGHPPKHVSTSFVERQNWTVRATIRRYTRLSNGFSRKLANHAVATALNYFAYNFIKIHRTLRVSPVMASGVTDRLWSVEDLVALWEAYEQRRTERQVA
jgi:hypothetical protein